MVNTHTHTYNCTHVSCLDNCLIALKLFSSAMWFALDMTETSLNSMSEKSHSWIAVVEIKHR